MTNNRIEELRRNYILKKHGKCPGPDVFASENDALKKSTFPDEDEIIRMMEDEHGVPSRWIELLVGERDKRPSHPAIPDEVRETLQLLFDYFSATYPSSFSSEKLSAAHNWLAQCQTATDNAVCPRCSGSVEQMHSAFKCSACDEWVATAHKMVSPPRAPKVECPGPDCSLCNGSACDKCGAGCWSNEKNCQHDVVERHEHTPRAPKVTE